MYFLIEDTLRKCAAKECRGGKSQYVAVLSPEEWQKERDCFDMGIDMDFDILEIHNTKAEVNYDSVTGTFALPDREDMSAEYRQFGFGLEETGIVFIEAGDTVTKIIEKRKRTKK